MRTKTAKKESSEKDRLLQTAIQEIEKSYGKGAIMRLGEAAPREAVPAIPTGALPLDLALGVGGLPRGRIVEIFGPEAGGKTTLALHVVAEAQRTGGTCAFIDAEHALDPAYAAAIGVDVDELLISQPDTGEQGLQIADSLVRTGAVDVIVVDSVAALVPAAELEGRMGDVHVGLQARLMSQALRKLTHTVSKSKSVVIFINQLRERIGNLPPGFRGELTTTPGGRALKFYASVRIDVRPFERIKQTIGGEDRVIGRRVIAKVVKNKCAPPFREARFEIVFGQGVSREGCLIDMGLESGVIERSGAFFAFGEERLGQGREAVRGYLKENPGTAAAIEKALTEKIRPAP